MPRILAAFKKKEDERTLFLSISSSSHTGEYLIGISLFKDKVIIAHDCPQIKFRKRSCKHAYLAYKAFQKHLWWIDLSDKNFVIKRKDVVLSPEWIQIPIPGTPPDFGENEGGKEHVHSA
ncbi:hypothetical protein B0W44_07665 [Novibacillus thermophilus]|uniref:SWIM-type domain-containing protein n=1 Tax=Novibacillus thermophilus TaxID=1471761 RepID=A0A1U9K6M3_9BACL|nr:hypothetical protein B0W44_07665 [Novibacillus thermophilus]